MCLLFGNAAGFLTANKVGADPPDLNTVKDFLEKYVP